MDIVCVEFLREVVKLKCNRGWVGKQPLYETDTVPSLHLEKALVHQRSRNSSDEYFVHLPIRDFKSEVYSLRGLLVLEGE